MKDTLEAMMPEALVKKKIKNFRRIFRPYGRKLESLYGDEFARKTMEQTRIEYERLLPETPYFEGRANIFNLVIGILPEIVAFYKAMQVNGKSVDEVGKILIEIAEKSHNRIPRVARWIGKKFIFSPFFMIISKKSAKHVSRHPEGWDITYNNGEGKSTDWSFECTRCGVINYFKKHGAQELAKYCNYIDYVQSKVFCMGMQNPRNIGQGDEVCIEYMKQNRVTAVPTNLEGIVNDAHQL